MWDLISGAQLDEYLDQGSNVFLVDMRDANSYRRAHIRGAVNIPAGGTAKQDRRAAAGPPDRAVLLSWTEQHAGREVAGLPGAMRQRMCTAGSRHIAEGIWIGEWKRDFRDWRFCVVISTEVFVDKSMGG